MPAVTATGFPDNVPAWYTPPSGATISIISLRPPYTASGMPPPAILPSTVISGTMPKYSCAPPFARRKPVITSSNTRRDLYCFVISLRPSRNPGTGGTTPIFAATGSTITAAILLPYFLKRLFTDRMSLYSATNVLSVQPSGTPRLSCTDCVNAPEPAFTRSPSECP